MVEPPQYYQPPSLAHTNEYSPAQYTSPASYNGFQIPPRRYLPAYNQSPNPPESPTFALRPALGNVFSHIEHPARSHSSDEEEDESRGGMRLSYPPSAATAFETVQRDYRSTPQYGDVIQYAMGGMERGETVRPAVPRRGRGGSDSSIGSMMSNAAVVGEGIYRTDALYNCMSPGVERRASERTITDAVFQPQSAPAAYAYAQAPIPYDDPSMLQDDRSFQPSTRAVAHTVSSMHEMELPFVPSLPQRSVQLELMETDHPFVYRGADWDYPMREMTDPDGVSVDSRDRGSSSRGSSEPVGGGTKSGKKGSKEKKKTGMACHFCRFRKLKCDGGNPCGHCVRREKDCTYDAIVRRRGPGRKNKSAQETARVQLAHRQKEEAGRETALQFKAKFSRAESSRTKATQVAAAEEKRHRDMSSQTSPQRDRYVRAAEFLAQSASPARTSQDSPGRGPQEYQAFSIQFEQPPQPPHGRETTAGAGTRKSGGWPQPPLEAFPPSIAHQQHHSPVDRLPYGLQTPASSASLNYYDGSPERPRVASSSAQLYLSSSRAQYQSGSQGDEGRYSTADSDSVYAYSEGANVVPSRYGQPSMHEQPPREDCTDVS